MLKENKEQLLKLIDSQANDDALWFIAEFVSEAYLQNALRELHAACEKALEHE